MSHPTSVRHIHPSPVAPAPRFSANVHHYHLSQAPSRSRISDAEVNRCSTPYEPPSGLAIYKPLILTGLTVFLTAVVYFFMAGSGM